MRAVLDDPSGRRIRLDGSGQASSVPVTIRALLGARIDALSDDAREILRLASVIGMTFEEPFVAGIAGKTVEPSIYERLADASLIVPVDAAGRWRFGHPLIHDAAYAGLLGTRRRQVHGRVADRLEASGTRGAIGVLARHRAAAGDKERGVPLLIEAGEDSLAVGAADEAAQFWTAAAELLGDDPAADECRRRAREALGLVSAATAAGA
jgi:predicted ATPase